MVVLDRNWRCAHGEIDIVARDGDCLVVCEVKTRRATAFGEPVEAVTRRKAARLRRLAARLAGRARPSGGGLARCGSTWSAILRPAGPPPRCEHSGRCRR